VGPLLSGLEGLEAGRQSRTFVPMATFDWVPEWSVQPELV
jgi:hypothetical protein